ncbi:MAG: flippase-like domain-containing protein [Rhodothermaceae bacterium]|nr:flippase-like domain-containing protein [Rhodothermaceae bacterium]MXZ58234.1 flippase-like domain-containing protein [Rhodothermaceae bacterium]MYB91183.1 flippase-like domain-containing protein [Rhodothermaceae bacterium]MYD66748.1 flippase-like domain-containing protein [Rhodothermaceae bacterium]MYG43988.1 flippase-like domain-containing protein [Rhodothermaceae bacterium]
MVTRPVRLHILLLSFLLAAFLIWLSLRDVEFAQFIESVRFAHYGWILPVIGVTLLSHWIRAYRWQALIIALPEDSKSRVSTLDLFASVMVGNMVNYVIPRAGEIARCTHLSTRKKLSFSALLGTVAIERIADLLVLGFGLLITLVFIREQLQSLFELLSLRQLPWVWIAVGCLMIAIIIYIGLRLKFTASLRNRLSALITQFANGIKTVYRTPKRWRLIWTTVIMWLMYGFMAYIPLVMFELDLSYWDGLAIMFIGVLGILVPTPGGLGSFHGITILTLTSVYGIARPDAAAYAIFVHGAQLILYLAIGGVILLTSAITSRAKV